MELEDLIGVSIEKPICVQEPLKEDPLDLLLAQNAGSLLNSKSIFANSNELSLNVDLGGLYWINFDSEDQKNHFVKEGHVDALTVVPKGNPMAMQATRPIRIVYENPKKTNVLGVPRFFGLGCFGRKVKDHRKMGLNVEVPAFKGSLRPMQEKCLDQAEACLLQQGGTTVIADCGFGKTATAIRIALQMKRPTLILCNREILMEQWTQAIRQFSETSLIGWIQGSSFDKGPVGTIRPGDKFFEIGSCMPFFTVGSIVSFGDCSQDKSLLHSFGLVIVDEMHHIAAPSLVHVVPTLPSAQILGLTATPQRSDGLEHVLQWLTGPTSFVQQRLPSITGLSETVHVQSVEFSGRNKEIVYKNGTLGQAQMLTFLTEDPLRNACLQDLMTILYDNRDKTIVVTSHVAHAKLLQDFAVQRWSGSEVAIMAGPHQMPKEAKERPSTRIVVATQNLLEEGQDDPSLDGLLLAMPRSRIQQTIGRIERHKDGKKRPFVIDLVDDFSLFPNMARKRKTFQKSRGFLCTTEKYKS